MQVSLKYALSDAQVDATQPNSQRQVAFSISAVPEALGRTVPLNLCLVLDQSGSMEGKSLSTVKQAAQRLIDGLSPGDRISIVTFNHKATVLLPNQIVDDPATLKRSLQRLEASGGTAIDEGLRLGIEEIAKGKKDAISQLFLLTDGENEHGSNDRCLKLAQVATGYNLTLNSLGFGSSWNQDILEKIADAGGGTLSYIQQPEQAMAEFGRLFSRVQAVGLTNAFLTLTVAPGVRLAEMKPLAQVAPDTIELLIQQDGNQAIARLGDLMMDVPRVILANLYVNQLPEGKTAIAHAQLRYDDPTSGQEGLVSESFPVEVAASALYQPMIDAEVQQHILALAKYRQTQIAEMKLQQGDRAGAATMLQTAANTALQMGDQGGATVLQINATRLQSGEVLSEADRKKTRLVSKTILQPEESE
ncbi:vWA domain-containing protein [Myxacorys almedinensis]|uniref:VWA domain-containing protein n=1 Tax=Myxacorys almedinensis A TaxID=2690445 RepID=A0A8J7Z8I7_9CYAN|nr:VWA domain-containing protein [Myxacorys almedinensis]NDJ18358.1 VWA domain-containing protein [Myxacorys almedinensis A]